MLLWCEFFLPRSLSEVSAPPARESSVDLLVVYKWMSICSVGRYL